jgi:hypothetical protein
LKILVSVVRFRPRPPNSPQCLYGAFSSSFRSKLSYTCQKCNGLASTSGHFLS